jgi:anti-sigma factor ChrR (cupin superfamily)
MGLARLETDRVVAESGRFADKMLLADDSVGERILQETGVRCNISGNSLRLPSVLRMLCDLSAEVRWTGESLRYDSGRARNGKLGKPMTEGLC